MRKSREIVLDFFGVISTLKSDMTILKDGQTCIENRLDDFRDACIAESANTRSLFHQACTHISDQIARDESRVFSTHYPR